MLQSDRREFLKLAGMAGVTFTAGLFPGRARAAQAADFHFVQFSDTHWGYSGAANPDAEHTLAKAVATVNGLARQPDFIVFTGDLTHTTDDPKLRRERMKRFREIVSALAVKDVRFMPGEHDASLDKGEAYREFFGAHATTRSTTRARTSSLSTTSPIPPPSWATSSSPGSPPTSSSASPTIASSCSRTGPCSTCSRNGTGPPPTAPRRSSS